MATGNMSNDELKGSLDFAREEAKQIQKWGKATKILSKMSPKILSKLRRDSAGRFLSDKR